jgi:hypothetical protein
MGVFLGRQMPTSAQVLGFHQPAEPSRTPLVSSQYAAPVEVFDSSLNAAHQFDALSGVDIPVAHTARESASSKLAQELRSFSIGRGYTSLEDAQLVAKHLLDTQQVQYNRQTGELMNTPLQYDFRDPQSRHDELHTASFLPKTSSEPIPQGMALWNAMPE